MMVEDKKKGVGPSGWGRPFLVGVEVGRSFSGLALVLPVGVAPPGPGWPFCLGLWVGQLSVVIIIITNKNQKYDGGKQERGWPFGWL